MEVEEPKMARRKDRCRILRRILLMMNAGAVRVFLIYPAEIRE